MVTPMEWWSLVDTSTHNSFFFSSSFARFFLARSRPSLLLVQTQFRRLQEENALLLLQHQQQHQKDQQISSSSTAIDMGRRKLPTLPQRGGIASTSQPQQTQPPTTTYYTSSTQMDKEHIRFDASTSAASRLTSSALHDPLSLRQYRPTQQHTSSFTHPIDPAILPGAQFRVPTQPRQQKQAILGGAKAKSVPTSPKISDTMSQLLFKQELRQALSRRRLDQETVESEANHREFLIRRMFNSGLIPADCRREIDSIPQVTKCDLPYELIAGARVVPPGFYEYQRRQKYGGHPSPRQPQQERQEWQLYEYAQQPPIQQYYTSSKRSVACQYDVPSSSPTFQRRYEGVYSATATTTPHSSPYMQRRQQVSLGWIISFL